MIKVGFEEEEFGVGMREVEGEEFVEVDMLGV